jgi:predicted CoA-binding protein
MASLLTEPQQIDELLARAKSIAVVGVSDKPDRASHGVAKYMQENTDYELYFVNPTLDKVLGQKCFHSLADIPVHIDIVDVFRKPSDVEAVMDEAISIGASTLWMQLGISEETQAARGVDAGVDVVQDKCIKIEIARIKN